MNRHILLFLLIFAATPLRWAFADEEVKDAATDQARKLHDEGTALFQKQDYAGACAAFAAAYSLKRHYQIAGSLGDCEMQLGRNRDAAEHLDSFIREYPTDESPEELERAKGLLAKARLQIATLVFDVPMTGAQVFLDGQPIGKAPIEGERFVEAGQHRIEAMVGLELVRQTVDVSVGEQRVVKLEARPAPKREKRIETGPDPRKIAAAVAGGVAVASAGVGIGFFLAALSKGDEKTSIVNQLSRDSGVSPNSVCAPGTHFTAECYSVRKLSRDQFIFNDVAIGAVALGAVAGATSLVLALLPTKSTKWPKVEASGFVTPMGGGFALQGRF